MKKKPITTPIGDASLSQAKAWSRSSDKDGARWMQAIIIRMEDAEAENQELRELLTKLRKQARRLMIGSRPIGSCKTCTWWGDPKRDGVAPYACCGNGKLHSFDGCMPDDGLCSGLHGDTTDTSNITGPDFYCIHYEPKE